MCINGKGSKMELFKSVQFISYVWLIVLPTSFMAIDVVTGFVNAWSKCEFQSVKMRSGLAKKVGEISVLIIGGLLTEGLGLSDYIMHAIALYIMLMELMSIMENLDKLGAPLPTFVKNAINNIGESVQHDELPDVMKKLESLEKTIEQLQNEDDGK